MSEKVEATFKQHLALFKQHMKPVAFTFVILFIIGYQLSPALIDHVKNMAALEIIAIHPYEILMTRVKVGFYTGLIATLPITCLQIYRFFAPALTPKERRAVKIYLPFIFLMTMLGAAMGFLFLSQMTTGFLKGLAQGTGILNRWTISNVIGYMLKLSLSASVIFNIPLVVVALVKAGAIETTDLKIYRKHVLIGSVALSALISPPDFLSMGILALPTYGFYEIGVKASAIL